MNMISLQVQLQFIHHNTNIIINMAYDTDSSESCHEKQQQNVENNYEHPKQNSSLIMIISTFWFSSNLLYDKLCEVCQFTAAVLSFLRQNEHDIRIVPSSITSVTSPGHLWAKYL